MTTSTTIEQGAPVSGTLRFDAIGTVWQIDTPEPIAEQITASVARVIADFDVTWSRFRSDSIVSDIAARPGRFEFGPDAPALFDLFRTLYDATDGRMNPLVGRALEQSGYDRDYSLRRGRISPIPRFDEAVSWDGAALTTHSPVVLDVGAAGKGYLVDLVARELVAHGIDAFTIDASGDIVHRGSSVLRVALEHPLDASLAVGLARVRHAICASSSNRRAWAGTHHIIDGVTGAPVRDIIATWAIADSGLIADGVATALFFTDPQRLSEVVEFEHVRMFANGRVEASAGFDGEVFA